MGNLPTPKYRSCKRRRGLDKACPRPRQDFLGCFHAPSEPSCGPHFNPEIFAHFLRFDCHLTPRGRRAKTAGARTAIAHGRHADHGRRGQHRAHDESHSFDADGDAIPIDTLLWPAKCGYRVVEVPIDYQERVGFSKLRKLAGRVWTFIRLAKTVGVGERGSSHYEVWKKLDG